MLYLDIIIILFLFKCMVAFLVDWQDDADRKEETLAIIEDLLGFSWGGKTLNNVNFFVVKETSKVLFHQ